MLNEDRLVRLLDLVRKQPVIMGILNVTPDSFSDGGKIIDCETAEAAARRMIADGAGMLDIGGESTRPGSEPVSAEEEMRRVLPVVRHLASCIETPVSVDTFKAVTARAAIAAGAVIVNDVTGLRADRDMARVVADTGAGVIITYNRGQVDPAVNIVADMLAFFDDSLVLSDRAGIRRENIWLDPGVGFAKTPHQNLEVICQLGVLSVYGLPVLVGLSRKSFIGHVTGRPVGERLAGSLTAHLLALQRGARILRVHDVAEHADMLKLNAAIEGAGYEN